MQHAYGLRTASNPPVHRTGSRRVLVLVAAVVVTGMAMWSAGMLPWNRETPVQIAEEVSPTISPSTSVPINMPALPDIPVGTDASASETPLPLILSGTQPGRNASEGTAFIGVDAGSPQTYMAGAILANGARLAEIHRDHVVLTRGGESVELYLQGVDSKADASGRLSALLRVGGRQPDPPLPAPSSDLITDYLRPSPVYDGDLIKGYQVYPGKRSGVFTQLGLKGGDVITAINDAPFAGAEQAIDLFRQIAEGIAVVATVEREGQYERISLDGSLILADQEQQKSNAAAMAAMPFGPPLSP